MAAFAIEPALGFIAPKSSQSFTVRFAPQTPGQNQCALEATLAPLNEEQQAAHPLSLPVVTKATRPVCHFDCAVFGDELEFGEYIASGLRKPSQMGASGKIGEALPSGLRLMQSKSLGVQVRNKVSFAVLNTLDTAYHFSVVAKRVPDCFILLGNLRVGQTRTKKLPLVNKRKK